MDILNFISWIRGGRKVTTVDPAKTLLPVGLKDGRRDDEYLAGAISVEDLATQLTPKPTYKVYTALLTQSGGDNVLNINGSDLTIGVTYQIDDPSGGADYTNVGAPNNNGGTYFVATGTTPNSWGTGGGLNYNTGAPVVTVLEDTTGLNIYWIYENPGVYVGYSQVLNNASIEEKTFYNQKISTFVNLSTYNPNDNDYSISAYYNGDNTCFVILTGSGGATSDDVLSDIDGWQKTSIEIRVYY